MWLWKGDTNNPRDVQTVLCLDCGGGAYTNLQVDKIS